MVVVWFPQTVGGQTKPHDRIQAEPMPDSRSRISVAAAKMARFAANSVAAEHTSLRRIDRNGRVPEEIVVRCPESLRCPVGGLHQIAGRVSDSRGSDWWGWASLPAIVVSQATKPQSVHARSLISCARNRTDQQSYINARTIGATGRMGCNVPPVTQRER